MRQKLVLSKAANLLAQKRVLMRADFNVPIKGGKIANATRITETLPTIEAIMRQKPASLVLMSHLGRPDGHKKEEDSLRPVAEELAKFLGKKVRFVNDCVGDEAKNSLPGLKDGEIVLLENLRFYAEEEGKSVNEKGEKVKAPKENVKAFSKTLSSFGDIFVNDAFGTAHRAHASMVGIDLPIRMAGLLMEKELKFFSKVLEQPEAPLVLILGGAKVADKLPLIQNFLDKADHILIGGGMSFTFLKEANGNSIGKSLYDQEKAALAKSLLEQSKTARAKIVLPQDVVVGSDFKTAQNVETQAANKDIDASKLGVDVGPKTIEEFRKIILGAKTIVMNGPLGVFEVPEYSNGSIAVVEAIVEATKKGAVSVIGGGDSLNLISKVKGAKDNLSHVSTGGGASLELLEGKVLPGIAHLSDEKDTKK